jgi:Lrp/AsnC family leucine-responsive transcriptional regulator
VILYSGVVAPDLEAYRRFQVQHSRVKGIRNMKTEIPMQQVKLSTELPLGPY